MLQLVIRRVEPLTFLHPSPEEGIHHKTVSWDIKNRSISTRSIRNLFDYFYSLQNELNLSSPSGFSLRLHALRWGWKQDAWVRLCFWNNYHLLFFVCLFFLTMFGLKFAHSSAPLLRLCKKGSPKSREDKTLYMLLMVTSFVQQEEKVQLYLKTARKTRPHLSVYWYLNDLSN